ncbi:hypothetical protein FNV43_RR13580 [Rhamnella rubrinervis]|uniref:IST1-like protein n=1 Tax=Rhamnella rubrinervis TaxID=2594499 RepID=A0A8K0H1G0_9ROSA|nr:hypothetical protein FNV43_RR13580 [Rhamnella rubrinervis]
MPFTSSSSTFIVFSETSDMFDILFGWRKASKCKRLIKQVQCRLKLLKNKRNAMVRQLREDMAELIKNGHENIAFNRAEQLIPDESVVQVYELLDHFCEFILLNFSYIRRHKDCPNDVNEAVSSLIYASARCGDLPELRLIRKLFEDRYGLRFAMVAVDLLSGNLVNRQVKEDSGAHVPDANLQTCHDKSETKASNVEVERQIILVDSSSTRTSFRDLNVIKTATISSSMVQQALPTVSESSMHDMEQKEENQIRAGRDNIPASGLENKGGKTTTASSSESLPQFPEETVVYLDDIEEFQSSTINDKDSLDQRLFKFKSSIPFKKENGENRCDIQVCGDKYELWSEKSGSKSSRRSCKGSGKRPRRRSVPQETTQCIKDIECISYYGTQSINAAHKHMSHQPRKQQRKIQMEQSEESYYEVMRVKQPCCLEIGNTLLPLNSRFDQKGLYCSCCSNKIIGRCSLESPCYSCAADDDNKDCGVPSRKQRTGITTSMEFPPHFLDQKNLWAKYGREQRRRSYDNGAMVYDVFTYPDHQPISMQNKDLRGKADEFGSLSSSPGSRVRSSWASKETVPPYLRTVTMPPERPKNKPREDIQRSNSCSFGNPNHVHPKLPDYDDITARFLALKRENMQNKQHYSKYKQETLAQYKF